MDNKDAEDFYFLLKNYYRAGNEARLYDEAFLALDAAQYDLSIAGATLLGCDAKLILEASTHSTLTSILNDATKRNRLLLHMERSAVMDSATAQRFLTAFEAGLQCSSISSSGAFS